MKSRNLLFPLTFVLAFLMAANSCKDEDTPTPSGTVPVLTTAAVSYITKTSARCGGKISSDKGNSVTARGVCWSTSSNPTISNNITTDGTDTGSFFSSISGLTANTKYYVRAYATNSTGTGYGNVLSFTTLGGTTSVTDKDGNVYPAVTINTQVWMAANLKTTKYNDGTAIPFVADSSNWSGLTTPAYCWYKNDAASYKATYGALYNWYAVDTKKLCPTGWHVSTDAEWLTLKAFLDDGTGEGGRLKEAGTAHWKSPNYGASNEFGFTALPGGRIDPAGSFGEIGESGYWWTSTAAGTDVAFNRIMAYDHPLIVKNACPFPMASGYSVRCVKD